MHRIRISGAICLFRDKCSRSPKNPRLAHAIGSQNRPWSELRRLQRLQWANLSLTYPVISVWSPVDLISQPACPVCSTRTPERKLAVRIDGLAVKRCPQCALLFLDPVPTDDAIKGCYTTDYYSGEAWDRRRMGYTREFDYRTERDRGLTNGTLLGFSALTTLDLRGKSILEIGCSDGALLFSLKKLGPSRLVGVDVNQAALNYGRDKFGLDLRFGSLASANIGPDEFDVVVMIDVLEHIKDVAGLFADAARCLKPNGVMVIYTPNAGALTLTRRRWAYLERSMEHVVYFSVESLRKLGAWHGLVVARSWSEGYPATVDSYRTYRIPRLGRLALQPHVALVNWFNRRRFAHAERCGAGIELRAILRRSIDG